MQEQEETKGHKNMKISIQNDPTSPPQKRPWSFSSLFFCCPSQDHRLESGKKKGNINSFATSHYSNGEPNSFIHLGKEKPKDDRIVIEGNAYSIGLLGKGLKRIICRSVKTNLNKKVSPGRGTNDLRTSKGYESNESLNPKRSVSELEEITNRSEDPVYKFTRHEIFSLYSQGIRVEKSDWNEVTPECVAQHIAHRLSGNFVIDALSGYGGNAIQFAKYCPFVIGVEIESHKIKKAEHNAGIYRVNHMMDLIQGDFFLLKRLRADVVFLAPSELLVERGEKFSIAKHLSPGLSELIRHSLTLADSLCILLPSYASIEELPAIFCDIFNESPEKYSHLNYTIEVESLYLEDCLVATVVLFGDLNKINNDEKREQLLQFMESLEKSQWQTISSEKFISRVFKHIGYHRSLTLLAELGENSIASSSVLDSFIELAKSKKLITSEILKQLQQPDHDSRLQSMSQPSMHKLLQPWSSGESKEADNYHEKDGPGTLAKTPSNKKIMVDYSHQNSHKTDAMREVNPAESYGVGRAITNEFIEGSPERSIGSPLKQDDEGRDQYPRSMDTSDMAVSSYSMKSDARLDSLSDTEAQFSLAVDGDQTQNRKNSVSSLEEYSKHTPLKKAKHRKSAEFDDEAEKEKLLTLI